MKKITITILLLLLVQPVSAFTFCEYNNPCDCGHITYSKQITLINSSGIFHTEDDRTCLEIWSKDISLWERFKWGYWDGFWYRISIIKVVFTMFIIFCLGIVIKWITSHKTSTAQDDKEITKQEICEGN